MLFFKCLMTLNATTKEITHQVSQARTMTSIFCQCPKHKCRTLKNAQVYNESELKVGANVYEICMLDQTKVVDLIHTHHPTHILCVWGLTPWDLGTNTNNLRFHSLDSNICMYPSQGRKKKKHSYLIWGYIQHSGITHFAGNKRNNFVTSIFPHQFCDKTCWKTDGPVQGFFTTYGISACSMTLTSTTPIS